MTKFYVATNGLHTVVVSEEQVLENIGDDESDEGMKTVAFDLAKKKFQDNNTDWAGLTITKELETDVVLISASAWYGDEPSHIGLSDNVFAEGARLIHADDDIGVDEDAEASSYHVQSWIWTDPSDLLETLSHKGPISNQRETPARGSDEKRTLQAICDRSRDVIAVYEQFQANPLDPSVLDQLKATMDLLKEAVAVKPVERNRTLVHSAVMQTWEVGESADEGFTAEQRKPFRVDVEQVSGSQLIVSVYPATESKKDANMGLGMTIELDKGLPSVHIGPAPLAENSVIARFHSDHEIKVTPGTQPGIKAPGDEAGALLFSNGCPLKE